jgi:uroporphyrinogen III methyltransferase/synthase
LFPGDFAIAGPAYAGIPVTHRAHNAVLTITGHEERANRIRARLSSIARAPEKVMLMGVERLKASQAS